jgi:hypothetical protein
VLEQIGNDEANRKKAEQLAKDEAAWNTARQRDTIDAYKAYQTQFATGAHSAQALSVRPRTN